MFNKSHLDPRKRGLVILIFLLVVTVFGLFASRASQEEAAENRSELTDGSNLGQHAKAFCEFFVSDRLTSIPEVGEGEKAGVSYSNVSFGDEATVENVADRTYRIRSTVSVGSQEGDTIKKEWDCTVAHLDGEDWDLRSLVVK